MVSARQAAYLQALGVDVYVPRGSPPWQAEGGAEAEAPAVPAVAAPLSSPVVRPGPSARPQAPSVAAPPVVMARAPAAAPQPDIAANLDWDELRAAVAACQRCELHATRTQTVFGVGNPQARWMFIGEAPGAEEDKQGEPFVGRAGQLLTSMIRALGLRREDVFIANVLKCRPPDNRDPRPSEAVSCRGFLERQVALVNPTLIVAVGRIAAQNLLATETTLAKLRGTVHSFGAKAWPVVVTYHPAYLLRSPGEKRKSWQDLLQAQQLLARLEQGPASGGGA